MDYVAVSVEDLTGAVRYERRVVPRQPWLGAAAPCSTGSARAARAALEAAQAEGLRPVGDLGRGARPRRGGVRHRRLRARTSAGRTSRSRPSSRTRLGLPVHVENESNLAALAEHWTGAAVGIDDFVCVFGEVGVGGGVVLGGRLFRGAHGFGGEFGHVSVDPEGHPCACGSRGCVETLVGQEAIARAAGISPVDRPLSRSLTDELVRRAGERLADRRPRALATQAAGSGSRSRRPSTSSTSQAVVLGGCFGPLAPWLVDDVRRTLEERSLAARSGSFDVLPSAFGDGAAVRGAAALSLRRVLDAPWAVPAGRHESSAQTVRPRRAGDAAREGGGDRSSLARGVEVV